MMKTVRQVMDVLSTYPPDSLVNAYEGEGVGLVIRSPEVTPCRSLGSDRPSADGYHKSIGWIETPLEGE